MQKESKKPCDLWKALVNAAIAGFLVQVTILHIYLYVFEYPIALIGRFVQ